MIEAMGVIVAFQEMDFAKRGEKARNVPNLRATKMMKALNMDGETSHHASRAKMQIPEDRLRTYKDHHVDF